MESCQRGRLGPILLVAQPFEKTNQNGVAEEAFLAVILCPHPQAPDLAENLTKALSASSQM